MTWLVYALGAVAAACVFVAGYVIGTRHGEIDSDSYWQGFAEGEQFGRMDERTPSSN